MPQHDSSGCHNYCTLSTLFLPACYPCSLSESGTPQSAREARLPDLWITAALPPSEAILDMSGRPMQDPVGTIRISGAGSGFRDGIYLGAVLARTVSCVFEAKDM